MARPPGAGRRAAGGGSTGGGAGGGAMARAPRPPRRRCVEGAPPQRAATFAQRPRARPTDGPKLGGRVTAAAGRRRLGWSPLPAPAPALALAVAALGVRGGSAEAPPFAAAGARPGARPGAECPYLQPAACRAPTAKRFLELWAKKVKCWLCGSWQELARLAVALTKDLVRLELGVAAELQRITGPLMDCCLPVYLLALLVTTRGKPLQPWIVYEFGLDLMAICQYDDHVFFDLFGVTVGQLSYIFGLIGQPYAETPQLLRLQGPERGPQEGRRLPWNAPLVIDVGLGLGADSRYYLRQGFRVAAVEANSVAIDTALADPGTRAYLLSGQLTVLNAAVAGPRSVGTHTSIWVVPYRPEQSNVAAWVAHEGGEEVPVRTVHCADLLRVFGQAVYMKVDVESNTIDCLASLRAEADERRAKGLEWSPPRLLSLEVEADSLAGPFYEQLVALGYRAYKACRQYLYSPGPCEEGSYGAEMLGCGSGPFGEAAVDYKAGPRWRDLHELLNDTGYLQEFASGFDWFDLHVTL